MPRSLRPKVLVDLSPLRLGYCGLWEYAYRLGMNLLSLYDPDKYDLTFLVPKKHPFPKDAKVTYRYISFLKRHTKIWTRSYDLFHSVVYPSPYMPGKFWFRGKFMATLHDLNFLYEKSDLKIKRYIWIYRRNISRIDQLVCISHYSENDAEKYLKYCCPSEVIYNGTATFDHLKAVRPAFFPDDERPYLFSVSTFMRKKNLHVLIPLMAQLPEYRLIIAGKVIHKDYFDEVKKAVKRFGLEDRIIFAGEITEGEKKYLYQHCDAFVFPSIAEGFGLPPIEAMSFGKPVFVSDRTSLPEVCGELAFYWTDFDTDHMAEVFRKGMQTYRNDPEYSEKLKQYAGRYSWEKVTSDYLRLYDKCLENIYQMKQVEILYNHPVEFRSGRIKQDVPIFSILIPTWNNLSFLKLCVESIQKNSKYPHQLIIHVNEGTDGSLHWVEEQGFDYTYSKKNVGVCYALNAAYQLASSDYILYINDDMYVCPDWDEALWNEIKKQPDEKFYISATAIEPVDVNKKIAIVPYNYGFTPEEFKEEQLLSQYKNLPFYDWCGSSWPPAVVHRKMWEAVKGYGVEFSPGMYSDPDFSMKLWQLGVRHFKGVAESRVYHFLESSTKRFKSKIVDKGSHLFLKKWGITSRTFYRFYLRMGEPYRELTEPTNNRAFLRKKILCKLKRWFV